MKTIYKNTFPICFLSKSSLLIFKRSFFQILDLSNGKITNLINFKSSLNESVLIRIPLLARIFRKVIRCGVKVSENLVLFVIGQRIYELDIVKKVISDGFITADKTRPLIFSKIEGINGFDDGIYFGGYIVSPFKKTIAIYKRISTDCWSEVFHFPNGAIEHVHNILADKYTDTIYIFTGDFNHSAGIWIAKNNFSSVVPCLIGEQMYRACIAFSTCQGLIYATDSPFAENSIRLLTKDADNKWVSKKIKSINGPSIYGCEWNGDIVFSTTVEDDGRNQSLIPNLLVRNRGNGIKSDFSFVYKGNLENGFKIIYKVKKDILPFFLFQTGSLIFPSGTNNSKYLPIFHIATKKLSMSTLILGE